MYYEGVTPARALCGRAHVAVAELHVIITTTN